MSGYHQRFLTAAACGAQHDGLCRHALELGHFELVDALPTALEAGHGAFMNEMRPTGSDILDLAYELSLPRAATR